ncbi:MAG: hypothetical protein JNG88_17365, partial [Phycisphaerales bacterium]|nr:hypothetical protein [Phycisphaerales bacterium]
DRDTPGRTISIRVTPTAYRTPKGEELFWGCNFLGATGSPTQESLFALDVGYPTDSAYIGRRFSYQEGPSRRPEAWARDRDYRWAEPSFTFRLPIVAENQHQIRMVGHVPVGFRVLSGDREIARFEQPQPETNAYTFGFDASKDGGDWLRLRVEPIAPFPSPNLDLRSLFFALERVEIVSNGRPAAFSHLPAGSLIELAFRSALRGIEARIEPVADWELNAGPKSAVQIAQEFAAYVLNAADSPPAGDSSEFASTQSGAELIQLALHEAQPVGDVAILVPSRQLASLVCRPGNNLGQLTSAFGAFAMLSELQIPTVMIAETRIPIDAGAIRCIIVPNPTWLTAAVWQRLARYVEQGGVVIGTAHVAAFGGEQRAEAAGLFGATPKEYHRYFFKIPFGEIVAYAPNSDWQAMIQPSTSTSETLAPLINARGETPDPPPPAVTANRVGAGTAVLLGVDSFEFYARFGAPTHRDLIAWIIDRFVPQRALEIKASPSVAVSLRQKDRQLVIGLVNMSRGHFDYGGLMNSARPLQFVEDIPPTGPIEIRLRTPRNVLSVEFLPRNNESNWSSENGLLTIRTPGIHTHGAIVLTYAP